MLPLNELSSSAVLTGYPDPVKQPGDFLIDWERGGVALNDASAGLLVQLWTLTAVRDPDDSELRHLHLTSPMGADHLLFSGTGISEVALSFDQNMNPFVAYVQEGVAKFYWYDSTLPGMTTTNLPTGSVTPRCTLDEKREANLENSDNVLAYVRDGWLRARYQRDRYLIEYDLAEVGEALLVSMAMNVGYRIQFRLRNVTENVDDGRFVTRAEPLVADIVIDICRRVGIDQTKLDVTELYNDSVIGYPVMSSEAASEHLRPLSDAFFFDPSEYDKKIRFLKRGREPVMRITWRDLVENNGGAMQMKRVQEDKLPRRVDVKHLDPAGGLNTNKQSAFRKSNLIKAKSDVTIELPFATTADFAASLALKHIKMKWHEQMTHTWALTLKHTRLVPGDTIEYEDRDGNVYRIRIEERNEDTGVLDFKGKQDGGPTVYNSSAKGLSLGTPISTTPGLVGGTRLEVLNIPVQRDQDDQLGVYVAVAGETSVWYGAEVLMSIDGINYTTAFETEVPATLGETESALLEEISAEYPSRQTVIVKSNFELESVTRESLMLGYNRCVIGDEVLQFQTATYLGANRYLLSGLVRGRYNTTPDAWPIGTRFVMIDTALTFVQAQSSYLGREIFLKPVSYGTTEDEAVPTSYDFDEALSQTEWPPHRVSSVRAGGDVTVTWIGRARISAETSPRHSQYFTGYRAKFSDGVTIDTSSETVSRTSVAAGVTVEICGLNSFTGEGPYTSPIEV